MENKIVMKSKIRLARNLKEYPFPRKLDKETAQRVIDLIKDILIGEDSKLKDELDFFKIEDLDELKRISMVEDHLISLELANSKNSAVFINKNKTLSIMINEEDHIRIQSMYDGFNLTKAYDLANEIDDLLEEKLQFAFHESLGYLTACPTNTGTGMRATIMIHLPALTQLKCINDVYKISSQIGLSVRGIYGEKSEALGNIYQISNQLTLGRTENNTIDNIRGIVAEIVLKEIQGRDILKSKLGIRLEDEIFRSLGILKNTRIIDSYEAMKHLSNIKLGIEMEYIQGISLIDIDNIMIGIQPAHQCIANNNSNKETRDINRAIYIREKMKDLDSIK